MSFQFTQKNSTMSAARSLESEDCRIVRTRWIGNHAATRLYSGCGQWKWALGKHMKSSPLPDTSTCFPSAAHARNTNTSQLPSKAAKKKCVQRLFTRSSPGDQSSCGWPPKIIWMPPETTTAEGAGHSFKKTCWRGGELNYIILYPIQNN